MAKAKDNKKPVQKSKTKPVRRLYRASEEKSRIGGVCAGIAEYFNIDPTLVRLLWVLLFLAGGCGILAYIIFWIVMDRKK